MLDNKQKKCFGYSADSENANKYFYNINNK